jgi:hypothetical protein
LVAEQKVGPGRDDALEPFLVGKKALVGAFIENIRPVLGVDGPPAVDEERPSGLLRPEAEPVPRHAARGFDQRVPVRREAVQDDVPPGHRVVVVKIRQDLHHRAGRE